MSLNVIGIGRFCFYLVLAVGLCGAASHKKQELKAPPIVIGLPALPPSLDPRFGIDQESLAVRRLIHCSLFDFAQDGRIVGDLVRQWKWSPDGLSLTLQLRSDVYFSDGQLVTSHDVKATLDALIKNILDPLVAVRLP